MLARYADDVVVMCRSREQAEAALARLTDLLAELGLEPKLAKTRIVHLVEGGEGLDFLGFHNRLVRGWTPRLAFDLSHPLARTQGGPARPRPDPVDHRPVPAAGAGRADRGGAEPVPPRLGGILPIREFRAAARPDQELCPTPARAVVVKTRQPAMGLGVGHGSGAVVSKPPGPDQSRWDRRPAQANAGLESRMPPVKNVGKPCAGEPHARFDGRGTGNGASTKVNAEAAAGKPQAGSATTYSRTSVTAPVPDPPRSLCSGGSQPRRW